MPAKFVYLTLCFNCLFILSAHFVLPQISILVMIRFDQIADQNFAVAIYSFS